MTKNIFIISLIFIASCNAVLKFPKIFQNGMVLQAGPTQANVWGFLEENVLYDVKLELECTDNHKETLTFVPNVVSFVMNKNRKKISNWYMYSSV